MPKAMRIAAVCWASLLCSCATAPVSALRIEDCIVGTSSLLCMDPRLDELRRNYALSFSQALNYRCRKPKDDHALIEKLIQYEAIAGGE